MLRLISVSFLDVPLCVCACSFLYLHILHFKQVIALLYRQVLNASSDLIYPYMIHYTIITCAIDVGLDVV